MSATPPVVTRLSLPGIRHLRSGKVREVFDLGEHLLFVATDRISAFDCILPTGIPWKGHVLSQLSSWWFRKLASIVPNHLVTDRVEDYPSDLAPFADLLRGRSMIVRRADVIPVECVARGYLIGSGWADYQRTGKVGGHILPAGLRIADRLPAPLFSPARKAETGHDENIDRHEVALIAGAEVAARLENLTLTLYAAAAAEALRHGIILADTKFEFGIANGEILLVDEALTPDSSRYWPADAYVPGSSPPSYDKQFVRDHLAALTWDRTPPAPPLPDDVVRQTSAKYLEAFRRLTGREPSG